MADMLRLPDETLATSFIYLNKYKRFMASSESAGSLDETTSKTLALACLSLASKSTESPRRLREFLLPAHRLLPRPKDALNSKPVAVPSATYDALRATLVQAELILLRVLGFDLRVPLPLGYLPGYLGRAMEDVADAGEDYDSWGKEEKEEYGVLKGIMDTSIGKACAANAITACKNYELANFFPARVIALGCLWLAMERRGLSVVEDRRLWVENIAGRKVDVEDFEEGLKVLSGLDPANDT